MKNKIIVILTFLFILLITFIPTGVFAEASGEGQSEPIVLVIKQDGFSEADRGNFQMNGVADLTNGKVSLVQNVGYKAGSFFSQRPIHIADGQNFGFSTYFKMETRGGDPTHGLGDGFVFIVSKTPGVVGSNAQGIGYSGLKNSAAVIFDFYGNEGQPAPMSTALGLNGGIAPGTYKTFDTNFKNERVWRVWIDYSYSDLKLEVRINKNNDTRPENASVTYSNLNLITYTGNEFYAGFTSATGGATMHSELSKWYFQATYSPTGIDHSGNYVVEDTLPLTPSISFTNYDINQNGWKFTPTSHPDETFEGIDFLFSLDNQALNTYNTDALIPYGTETLKVYTVSPAGNFSTVPTVVTFDHGSVDMENFDYFFDGFFTSADFSTPIEFDETLTGEATVFVKWVAAAPVNQFIADIQALPDFESLLEEDLDSLNDLRDQYNALSADQLKFLDPSFEEELTLYQQKLILKRVQDYVDALIEDDYTQENWAIIQGLLTSATDAVGAYTTIEEVEAYDVEAFKASVDAILTIEEELAEAKAAKVAELETLLATYTEGEYTEANWDTLEGYITSAIAEVNALTIIAAVNAYSVGAVEDNCDAVETIEETAARVLAETKQSADLAIDAIEDKYNAYNYGESNYQKILALIESAN